MADPKMMKDAMAMVIASMGRHARTLRQGRLAKPSRAHDQMDPSGTTEDGGPRIEDAMPPESHAGVQPHDGQVHETTQAPKFDPLAKNAGSSSDSISPEEMDELMSGLQR